MVPDETEIAWISPFLKKLTKNIEIHRNPDGPERGRFTGKIPYFLRLSFIRCLLHTVEVTGSNPGSPTIFFIFQSP